MLQYGVRGDIHGLVLKVTFAKMQRHRVDMEPGPAPVLVSVIRIWSWVSRFQTVLLGVCRCPMALLHGSQSFACADVHIKFPLKRGLIAFKMFAN